MLAELEEIARVVRCMCGRGCDFCRGVSLWTGWLPSRGWMRLAKTCRCPDKWMDMDLVACWLGEQCGRVCWGKLAEMHRAEVCSTNYVHMYPRHR